MASFVDFPLVDVEVRYTSEQELAHTSKHLEG